MMDVMRVVAPVVDRSDLALWCERHLGAGPAEELFRSGYLSTVVGVRLEDGRDVVVKVRRPAARLDGCVVVQREMAARGFACPEPLTSVLAFGDAVATAETYVPGNQMLPSRS